MCLWEDHPTTLSALPAVSVTFPSWTSSTPQMRAGGCVRSTTGSPSPSVMSVNCLLWRGCSQQWTGSSTQPASPALSAQSYWMENLSWRKERSSTAGSVMPSKIVCHYNFVPTILYNCRFKAAQCYRCDQAIVSTVGKRMTLITCDGKNYHYQCYSCKVKTTFYMHVFHSSYLAM